MTYKYTITGMFCDGCRTKVEKALNAMEGIEATVTLEPAIATITMQKPIQTTQFQEILSEAGKYSIKVFNPNDLKLPAEEVVIEHPKNTAGKYYCPMFCEGDKVYDDAGDCPVCGMDLVKSPDLTTVKTQYTCPMHPEIVQDGPGSCSICGMDLVPMEPTDSEENKAYNDLMKKMKIALLFTVPIFIIAMSDMIPNNPLMQIMDMEYWNWVQLALSLPVVFYAAWMFFIRAWKSVVTWNLNMFTLI